MSLIANYVPKNYCIECSKIKRGENGEKEKEFVDFFSYNALFDSVRITKNSDGSTCDKPIIENNRIYKLNIDLKRDFFNDKMGEKNIEDLKVELLFFVQKIGVIMFPESKKPKLWNIKIKPVKGKLHLQQKFRLAEETTTLHNGNVFHIALKIDKYIFRYIVQDISVIYRKSANRINLVNKANVLGYEMLRKKYIKNVGDEGYLPNRMLKELKKIKDSKGRERYINDALAKRFIPDWLIEESKKIKDLEKRINHLKKLEKKRKALDEIDSTDRKKKRREFGGTDADLSEAGESSDSAESTGSVYEAVCTDKDPSAEEWLGE